MKARFTLSRRRKEAEGFVMQLLGTGETTTRDIFVCKSARRLESIDMLNATPSNQAYPFMFFLRVRACVCVEVVLPVPRAREFLCACFQFLSRPAAKRRDHPDCVAHKKAFPHFYCLRLSCPSC